MGTTLLTAAKAKEITKNHNNLDDLLERIFYTAFKGESSFIVFEELSVDIKVVLVILSVVATDETVNYPEFIVPSIHGITGIELH